MHAQKRGARVCVDKNVRNAPDSEDRTGAQPVTIDDLGWTKSKAALIRAQLSAFAEDWDDPSMNAYDAL